jgi:dTDP-N-acetylfucosamine:lipid II N-acetylfucosaminyltransferase
VWDNFSASGGAALSQGTILHLFHWDKKFAPPFRDLIHEHFADGRHKFVVYGDVEPDALPASADTVVYRSLLKNFSSLSRAMHRAEKIILHGLFNHHMFYILALQPWLLKKCCWVIWGGDLYFHEAEPKSLGWKKVEVFRSFVIKRLGHFLTYVPGDYELAKQWYGAKGQYHECLMYPSNVYNGHAVKTTQHSTINIQIGNSADPSNNHLEVLERLMPYRDQDIAIYVPLSYGNKDHAAAVIKAGTEMFGKKFIPLTEFMPFDQYLEFLGNIDIAIFNHKRQQAMGNAIALLGLGKKVYMRNDVTSRSMFAEIGVKIFDISEIDIAPLSDNLRSTNHGQIANTFSKCRLRKQLEDVFED